jgi:hypothetical protein
LNYWLHMAIITARVLLGTMGAALPDIIGGYSKPSQHVGTARGLGVPTSTIEKRGEEL